MARRTGLYRAFFDKAEAIADEPNIAFWVLEIFSVLGSLLARRIGTHLEIWEHVSVAQWTAVPMWLALGLLGTLTLAVFATFVTPNQIGHSLAIALITWRLIRFLFGCIACMYVLWMLSSVVLVCYYDAWSLIKYIIRHSFISPSCL
jgi:hypothetical protein